jgi:hypothetical protein
MRASKSTSKTFKEETFEAMLERMPNRLRWVIARLPFDAAKTWGKRGQLRIMGEINGFAFSSTLFPAGDGTHFLIVNAGLQCNPSGCSRLPNL